MFQRKFSFVTSLIDFVRYFDCLDDVAFIAIGPHEYYKVIDVTYTTGVGCFHRLEEAAIEPPPPPKARGSRL